MIISLFKSPSRHLGSLNRPKMTMQILNTKLYIPSPPAHSIARVRLVRRLQQEQRLTLVSAPAGFGKTTLLSTYVAQCPQRVAWLSLDDGDNDLICFWAYVIAALQTVQADLGETALVALRSISAPEMDPILLSLLNDLAARSDPIVLILDDYHTITLPEIHQKLVFWIERLPPALRLIVASRQDPPFSLARWRAYRQLTEIRAADLRFSGQEAALFLNDLMALDLSEQDIATLDARTEGWIAGLQLAALSLRDTTNRSDFIQAFAGSHRFLTDYLVDEVLSRQTPALQRFLWRTSILERFCVGICDELVKDVDSRLVLRELEQANLFLIPLDNERRWFRYHHLFAEFLRLRFYENEPNILPELYGRAIDWFTQAGLAREALQYALKAHEYERAANLIETLAPEILGKDNHMLVIQWIEALPQDLVNRRAYLCAYLGWAWVIAAQMESASRWLSIAESTCDQLASQDAQIIQGHVAAHRAYVAFLRGEYTRTITFAHQALDLIPVDETVLRARTVTCLGKAYNYDGRIQEAKDALRQVIGSARDVGSLSLAMFSYCSLGEVFRDEGELAQALDTYRQLLQFSQELTGSAEGPLTGYAHFEIGVILCEQYELDRAIEQIEKGVRLCREWQQGEALGVGLLELAEAHRLRGEYAQAEAALNKARPVAEAISPWATNLVDAFAARLALSQGDIAAVEHWANHSGLEGTADSPTFCDIGYERIPECPGLIRLYLATGRAQQALTVTEHLCRRERAVGRMGRLRTLLVLQAVALDALGKPERALRVLAEAVENAEPHKHTLPFVDHGRTLLPYLRQLPPSPHRDRLLGILDADVLVQNQPTPTRPETERLDPLNEREIQVLRLMAAGLSNREIADELYLSVNTIRWYASQIYNKLDVKRRGEAVARAQEIGVL
jgi:ATP/maltotriose-dependent transcriptional regulator MalT